VSVTSSPPPGGIPAVAPSPAPYGEVCPLCGAPLHPEQEWCLHCGAAARTRLAASPSWKGLIATLATVVALSLGVLAASLVKLAGGSSTTPAVTTTVTTSPATTSAPPTTATSGAGLPETSSSTASTSRTGTPGAAVRRTTTSPGLAGILGLLRHTSPRTRKSKAKARGFGLGQAAEEELRKHGLLPGAGTR
jgi:hypothetical protein